MIKTFQRLKYYLNRWLLFFEVKCAGFEVIYMYPGFRGIRWTKEELEDQLIYFKYYPRHKEHIVASAIMDLKGDVWAAMRPGRHHTCIGYMFKHDATEKHIRGNTWNQGFMTNCNRFISRLEARQMAIANGQAKEENLHQPNDIFSEDLWDTPPRLYYREKP